MHSESFADGLEDTIARGGDTDTNGCITAALLGARFGVDNIPAEWIEQVNGAGPCRLSVDGVRENMDIDFLSIGDVDVLVPQLAGIS